MSVEPEEVIAMKNDSAVSECLAVLRKRITGELRTDAYSRMFYSTDASIYQVDPLAVVIPRHPEDVHAVVETAVEFAVPLLPRASGSSLAGQAIGEAIIVDCTRHLDKVLEIDAEARTARVEPGVILGSLNAELRPFGLHFGPDPASANRATIGGVVSNNSTGAHSIMYGMAADHVLGMQVRLSDGSRAEFGPTDETEVLHRSSASTREGLIYAGLRQLLADPINRATIRERTPRHWRRCGGYNLDRFALDGISFRVEQDPRFNVAALICGSEGTLAFIEEITLNLVPLPAMTCLAIVHFDELHAALEAVPMILEVDPSAVELLDHLGMSLCRAVPAWRRKLEGFVDGEPDCVLITEFYGESESELRARVEGFREHIARANCGAGAIVSVMDADGQADVWSVRKMGLGFLMSIKGDHKPIPFIEDAAVPLEHLAAYVTGIEKFCTDLDTKVAYYAHASAGCVHIRPLINTKSAEEIAKLPEIVSFAIELLHGFGGVLSSEHGDGRARSFFNERFFGADLYELYRSVKTVFDPDNLFNPGNIVNAGPMTENLRFGADYSTRRIETFFDFSENQGFDRAVEMCNGAGVCRKLESETMCPSFMATREEEHSTRGRANALRAVLSGAIVADGLADDRLFATMDLCLECKACASECPSSVDMAKLKMEFLAQYYDRKGIPLRARLFGNIARANRRFSGKGAPLVNALLRRSAVRWTLDKSIGITCKRLLPAFAPESFTSWFENRTPRASTSRQLVLFNDTFNTYNYPEVAMAATQFLEACGYEVLLPGHGCCGRPMLSKGLIAQARKAAHETLSKLMPFAEKGIPIVGLEPSCLLSFRDEYRALFPSDARVETVQSQSFLFDEFVAALAERNELPERFTEAAAHILYHGHCHQKALVGTRAARHVLALPVNYTVEEVDSGCCGMAGSFGFETEHYGISMDVGEDRLFPAIRACDTNTVICAGGVSCRQQIEHGTARMAKHPAEVLWEAVA